MLKLASHIESGPFCSVSVHRLAGHAALEKHMKNVSKLCPLLNVTRLLVSQTLDGNMERNGIC